MRKRMLAWAVLAPVAVDTVVARPAAAEPAKLKAVMTAEEVAPEPGPPGAKGRGEFEADPAAGEICYDLDYDGPGMPSAAHIHQGAAGVAGPVVIDLRIQAHGLDACVPADGPTLSAIIADPAGYYADIHTADYHLGGAVRGQLSAS